MRQFRDAAGVEWQAYQAGPQSNLGLREELLPESYRGGWLVFESPTEKRRLAPVPQGWQTLTPQELRRLCALATPTRQRRQVGIDVTATPPTVAPSGNTTAP